jgi:hypothetical protein
MMDWRELLEELERRTRPESWDDRSPFREAFLAEVANPEQRAGLRDFGRLLAFLVAEAPSPTSTPAAGWRAGLAATLADLRFDACQLAALCRDVLAAEPERSARHRRAQAVGELALELVRAAERLEALTARRRRIPRELLGSGEVTPEPGSR